MQQMTFYQNNITTLLSNYNALHAKIKQLTSVADAEMKLREGNFAEIERLRAALAGVEKCLNGVDPYSIGSALRALADIALITNGLSGQQQPSPANDAPGADPSAGGG